MSDRVLSVILEKLKEMRPEKAEVLNLDGAKKLTLAALDFDSLDTLKLAMDIEDALEMTIEAVNFPDTLSLDQLAERLAGLKSKSFTYATA